MISPPPSGENDWASSNKPTHHSKAANTPVSFTKKTDNDPAQRKAVGGYFLDCRCGRYALLQAALVVLLFLNNFN